MAKREYIINGNFHEIITTIESEVLKASFSATLEDRTDFVDGECRCSVRVFERYSAFGSNRVSLNVTLFTSGREVKVSAITSGGSQATFFKLNTIGEETFLNSFNKIIQTNYLSRY